MRPRSPPAEAEEPTRRRTPQSRRARARRSRAWRRTWVRIQVCLSSGSYVPVAGFHAAIFFPKGLDVPDADPYPAPGMPLLTLAQEYEAVAAGDGCETAECLRQVRGSSTDGPSPP